MRKRRQVAALRKVRADLARSLIERTQPMARQGKTGTRSRIARAGSAIKRTAKKLTTRVRPARRKKVAKVAKAASTTPRPAKKRPKGDGKAARPPRREPDIPLEVLN